MKNYKTIIATTVALLGVGLSARADLTGTAYLTEAGANPSQPDLQVNYDVSLASGVYTYSYSFTVGDFVDSTFTATTENPVESFTVDASYVIAGSGTSKNGASSIVIGSGDVVWNYATAQNTDTVTFQSDYGPTFGGASGNDGAPSVSWSSAGVGGMPVPVPVPEPSTVMAGLLMLLPLGAGVARVLRKDRTA